MKALIKITIATLYLIAIAIIFYWCYGWLTADPKDHLTEVSIVYFILAIFISTLILIAAYSKANQAIQNSRTNYLLRIDERWSSKEIIQAREVIHEIYLKVKQTYSEDTDEKIIRKCISDNICALSKNQSQINGFIRLLNFLDFLETIGYLYSIKAVSINEVNELLGNSIIYFFDIYKGYIRYRRAKCRDNKFYEHFEILKKGIEDYNLEIAYRKSVKSRFFSCLWK